jgi:hypothetical protein
LLRERLAEPAPAASKRARFGLRKTEALASLGE